MTPPRTRVEPPAETRTEARAEPPRRPKERRPHPIRDERGEITGYLMNATGAQWLAVERRALREIGLEEIQREQ
jgi:hypothetical protein